MAEDKEVLWGHIEAVRDFMEYLEVQLGVKLCAKNLPSGDHDYKPIKDDEIERAIAGCFELDLEEIAQQRAEREAEANRLQREKEEAEALRQKRNQGVCGSNQWPEGEVCPLGRVRFEEYDADGYHCPCWWEFQGVVCCKCQWKKTDEA